MTTDSRLLDFLPHRPPMLLLSKLVAVANDKAESEICISNDSSFFLPDAGVPSWVGVEYMGQTAALIAGFQLQAGAVAPHVGFLLGTRKYRTNCSYFSAGMRLRVACKEIAVVGRTLATFDCNINDINSGEELASARLSVFRKFIEHDD